MVKRNNKIGEFFPFYPANWVLSTSLQRCSLGARGLLVELMARAWITEGGCGVVNTTIDNLAFNTHVSYEEIDRLLAELASHDRIIVEDKDRRGIKIIVPLLSKVGAEQEDRYNKRSKAGKKSAEVRASRKADDDAFEQFWEKYPRKVKKQTAQKYWARDNLTPELEAILEGLDGYINKWVEDGTSLNYIPHPTTWLNARQWEDDLKITPLSTAPKMTDEEKEKAREDFMRRAVK